MTSPGRNIERAFASAKDQYAEWGVDVDRPSTRLATIAISLHCWQGDDVGGFENTGQELGGGLAVTGRLSRQGSRTADELRSDLDKTLALLPGSHRLNLHASYAETGGHKVERDALEPEHFRAGSTGQVQAYRHGLQPDLFRSPPGSRRLHPGPSPIKAVRQFWIDHGIACRRIGAAIGKALRISVRDQRLDPRRLQGYAHRPQGPAPASRRIARRDLRRAARPRGTSATPSRASCSDSARRATSSARTSFTSAMPCRARSSLCLDTGHYHPTELVSDKISAVLMYLDEILLHVSRGVRWDSDHVVVLSDELEAIAQELVRGDYLDRVHIGLDFFDASINRVAAWVIGAGPC